MSEVDQQERTAEDSGDSQHQSESPQMNAGGRKPRSLAVQRQARAEEDAESESQSPSAATPNRSRRMGPIRESRIKDRPAKEGEKDSSLKIKIELDLEVEVEIYARVKGDVTIGLL